MGTALVVAAIGFGAAVFMLGFLIALLGEGAPSVCYWALPVRGDSEKEGHHAVLCGIYLDEDCRATESGRGDNCLELLENENHEKEKRAAGLITFDVRHVSGWPGWRSIRARGNDVSSRPWFE